MSATKGQANVGNCNQDNMTRCNSDGAKSFKCTFHKDNKRPCKLLNCVTLDTIQIGFKMYSIRNLKEHR